MRLVGQLLLAATAIAAANGCDRHTRLSADSLAAEADANARLCAQTVMSLISLAFGPPSPVVAARTSPER
jgi:hypothetical protein